jgi:hypothetical protein
MVKYLQINAIFISDSIILLNKPLQYLQQDIAVTLQKNFQVTRRQSEATPLSFGNRRFNDSKNQ